jgi:hypothetical protein
MQRERTNLFSINPTLSMARITFFVFLIVTSCTIIEDSDITSKEELAQLKLKSVDIVQETASGTTTLAAKVTTDEEVSIPVPNGVITRTVWMDWPAFGNKKLKLKGGYTGAIKTYVSYLSNGLPYTFSIYDKDTTVLLELYRFRYSSNGKLSNILTNVPYVEGGAVTSRDTLIYANSSHPTELTSIIRNPKSTPITFALVSSGGSVYSNSWTFDFQGNRYAKNCQQPDCGGTWGGNYDVFPTSNGFPTGVMNLSSFEKDYLSIEDFNTIDQNFCGGSTCSAWIDTFYFHPLMVLKDDFVFADQADWGEMLLFIYMVDWWKPTGGQVSTTNEKVMLNFNYEF